MGTDALRANPLRTVLSTTGVIIGVAALVAAFAITDGVAVWSRDMLARESSVQDVAVTPVTMEMVNGRARAPIYPVVQPLTALLAVASAVIVGVVFGTYPARLAARLSPVDAISRE